MLQRFSIQSRCVADTDTLYAHMAAACERGLQTVGQYYPHESVAILVGSGPSILGQLDRIREERAKPGRYLVALKDAHDWLVEHGLVPDYAVALDPQASRAQIFHHPQTKTTYLIASQCHPDMFDHLAGYPVQLWHPYITPGQTVPPPGTPLVAGGTTTGLRAITLLYSMGFRQFELFGYDCCVQDGALRMNGTVPRPGDDQLHELVVNGDSFLCPPAMTAQASEFQLLFLSMPDIQIASHGRGVITSILAARQAQPIRTVSFLHPGTPAVASYRYRAQIPAQEMGWPLNDRTADVWVIAKPYEGAVRDIKVALGQGKIVLVDVCDDHCALPLYQDMIRLADAVTCSTTQLAARILQFGRTATVIDDPYEFDAQPPHCTANRLLYFGHPTNGEGLQRILPLSARYPFTIVTRASTILPCEARVVEWSCEALRHELDQADIVLIPATADYKSANRAVEAIQRGCYVVAEPHPSLAQIPGIWQGSIEEGVQWASTHPQDAQAQTLLAQTYISQRFDPRIVANAWSRVIQGCPSTSDAAASGGPAGLTLTTRAPLMSVPT